MTTEGALLSWLNTFSPDESATSLADFADGVVLLSVAEDVIEGFDFSRTSGLAGVLSSLEHAFAVRATVPARVFLVS